MNEAMPEWAREMRRDVSDLKEYVIGTPHSPGLKEEVGLLKERGANARWWGRTALGAAIVSIVGGLAAWSRTGGGP